MGRLRIRAPFLGFVLFSEVSSVLALGESYDQAVASGIREDDHVEENNFRGLSWFGLSNDGSENGDENESYPDSASATAVKLIESVPCEPSHERALQFVSLFGDIHSGNEACATESDPDSCSRGCCRFGTYFLCDTANAFTELPCLCGRNTAANHPHEGHLHAPEESSGVLKKPLKGEHAEENGKEKVEDPISPTTSRDGEGDTRGEDDPSKSTDTSSKSKKSEGFFTSVMNYLEGKSESKDDGEGDADLSSDANDEESLGSLDESSADGKERNRTVSIDGSKEATGDTGAPDGNKESGDNMDSSSLDNNSSTDNKNGDSDNVSGFWADEESAGSSSANDSDSNDTSASSSANTSEESKEGTSNSSDESKTASTTDSNLSKDEGVSRSVSDNGNDRFESTDTSSDDGQVDSSSPDGVNEASFGLGWGGPPPDYDEEPDPGASKHHGAYSSTTPSWATAEKSFEDDPSSSTNLPDTDKSGFLGLFGGEGDGASEDKVETTGIATYPLEENDAVFLTPLVDEDHSNRALQADYDHGPVNEVEFLSGWGG